MNRDEILARLREHEAALRSRGVAHVALFGSRARGDQRAGSDTDILVEFDPVARVTVFDYAALKNDIAALFDSPVDVVKMCIRDSDCTGSPLPAGSDSSRGFT